MNVFIVSPGRTATTTFSQALSCLDGYTSSHESLVQKLGQGRVEYPINHIECDNRLVWFLYRLTNKYSATGVLVILHRDVEKISQSYNKRWRKIQIMKAFSQGILMRGFAGNNIDVCREYVNYCYEQLNYFSRQWKVVIHLDVERPDDGIVELLKVLNRENDAGRVLKYIKENRSNQNVSEWKNRWEAFKYNTKCLISDLR